MMRRIFLVCTIGFMLGSAHAALAAGSGVFTINMAITTDTTPPTVPTNVVATPASASQIDVAWNPSTDNVQMGGYKVFRDGVQIANTQLTSFSDTGLTASTTYTYYIKAFDEVNNTSSSSATTSTTTLALPVVTPAPLTATSTTNHHYGGQTLIRLVSLQVTASTTSAVISWTTSGYAQSVLRWGTVTPYDLGYVQDQSLRRDHVTRIDGLQPGATYQYEVTAISGLGLSFNLTQGTFTTIGKTETTPLNVSGLTAQVNGNDVLLSWQNPSNADIGKIRVVRNYLFYPADPTNGEIVYEGMADSFFDKNALQGYPQQFYTVFVYDKAGNVSSGSIVLARKAGTANVPVLNERPVVPAGVGTAATGTATSARPSGAKATNPIITTRFSDFSIIQNDQTIHPKGTTFTITDAMPVLVQVPYDKVPEHLKSIIMTIDGKTSYLMRVSKDAKTYQAYIPALEPGAHTVEFAIYDFESSYLKKLSGTILVTPQASPAEAPWWQSVWTWLQPRVYWLTGGGVSLLALLIAYLIVRYEVRRRQ